MIAGKHTERSTNLVRGEIEGTATAVNAVNDGAVMGTEGGGGRRCCSSTTTIGMSPRGQIVKKKKHTQLIRTPQTLLQANLRCHYPRVLLRL